MHRQMAWQAIESGGQVDRRLKDRAIEIKAFKLRQILQSLLNIARSNMWHRLGDQIDLHRRNPQRCTHIADRMTGLICFDHCNGCCRTIVAWRILCTLKAIAIKDRAIYF